MDQYLLDLVKFWHQSLSFTKVQILYSSISFGKFLNVICLMLWDLIVTQFNVHFVIYTFLERQHTSKKIGCYHRNRRPNSVTDVMYNV